jgi:hypothetical protein
VQTPPGTAMKGRLHVMFLRGRMGKETGKGE